MWLQMGGIMEHEDYMSPRKRDEIYGCQRCRLDEGNQKAQTSSYKIRKYWAWHVHDDDYT